MGKYPLSTTIRDLATEWVLSERRGAPDRFPYQSEIMEEMFKRVSPEHVNKYLDEAEEIFDLLNP